MLTLRFKASIIYRGRGCYTAIADEWPIPPQTASTQRGAIKMVKVALLAQLKNAARRGTLGDVLDAAGYNGSMIRWPESNARLDRRVFNTHDVMIPLPRDRRHKRRDV